MRMHQSGHTNNGEQGAVEYSHTHPQHTTATHAANMAILFE